MSSLVLVIIAWLCKGDESSSNSADQDNGFAENNSTARLDSSAGRVLSATVNAKESFPSANNANDNDCFAAAELHLGEGAASEPRLATYHNQTARPSSINSAREFGGAQQQSGDPYDFLVLEPRHGPSQTDCANQSQAILLIDSTPSPNASSAANELHLCNSLTFDWTTNFNGVASNKQVPADQFELGEFHCQQEHNSKPSGATFRAAPRILASACSQDSNLTGFLTVSSPPTANCQLDNLNSQGELTMTDESANSCEQQQQLQQACYIDSIPLSLCHQCLLESYQMSDDSCHNAVIFSNQCNHCDHQLPPPQQHLSINNRLHATHSPSGSLQTSAALATDRGPKRGQGQQASESSGIGRKQESGRVRFVDHYQLQQ